MERVGTNAHVECVLAAESDHVLVDGDTSGFQGLGRQLLLLTGHEVDAQRELVRGGGLRADIVDADLGVGHAPQVSGLDVRLVLAVSVAAGGTATHGFRRQRATRSDSGRSALRHGHPAVEATKIRAPVLYHAPRMV